MEKEAKSEFQKLKDNKVKLTPEERKKCMDEKAVWRFNGGGPSPAVWKSEDKDGKITYVTNTHRAFNTAPTLKGAISRFHNFIKSTAGEENKEMEKQALLGLPGFIGGSVAGGLVGQSIGRGIANLKYKPTFKQQELLSQRDQASKDYEEALKEYYNKTNELSLDWDMYDSLLNEINAPEFDNLTVGEIEDYARNKYVSLNKTAASNGSMLSALGDVAKDYAKSEGKRFLIGSAIGASILGPVLGKGQYGIRKQELTDPTYVKNQINLNNDSVMNYKNKINELISNPDVAYRTAIGSFDHNESYSPSLLAKDKYDVACEGAAYYGEALNEKLKMEGIDYKTLPWGKYKELLGLNADNIANDDWSFDWDLKTASVETYKDQIYKTAAQMPYILSNGNYAVPKGWEPAYDSDNDDIEGTWQNDYYRNEYKIPTNYKRIAENGFGDSTFIDVNSDKNNPDYYDWDHETAELTKWDEEQKIQGFTVPDIRNNADIYNKLKLMNLDSYKALRNIPLDQMKEIGYTEPTLENKIRFNMPFVGTYLKRKAEKSLNETNQKKRGDFKRQLLDSYYDEYDNQDFLNQYKTASVETYKNAIYKTAGVEYGWRAYQGADADRYLDLAKRRDSLTEDEENELFDMWEKEKGPTDYGYPIWSEKALAITPYNIKVDNESIRRLQEIMGGGSVDYLKNITPIEDGYTGSSDGTSFIGDRSSAEEMLKLYDGLLSAMPQEYSFDRSKYEDSLKQMKDIDNKMQEPMQAFRQKTDSILTSLYADQNKLVGEALDKQEYAKNLKWYNLIKKNKVINELNKKRAEIEDIGKKINETNLSEQPKELKELQEQRNMAYDGVYRNGTNSDVVREYRSALANSLKDPNNTLYQWGWR